MALLVADFLKPHVDSTVQEFMDDIMNKMVSRVVLGFPLPQYCLPWPFK